MKSTGVIRPKNVKSRDANLAVINLRVASETWRFYAYLSFWFMCFFAMSITSKFVVPRLEAGPEDGLACGEFAKRNDPNFGVEPGQGFTMEQTHLQELFGFANICTNWDYSPARELTAMVYPLFEYSLLIYLCLDFCATYLAHERRDIGDKLYTYCKIMFPISLFLCSMFRMIFVCLAYEEPAQHTMGFVGMQITLMIIATTNTLFVLETGLTYPILGAPANTRRLAIVYITGIIIFSSLKLVGTIPVVLTGTGPLWYKAPLLGLCVGQWVDRIWMVLNAVIPLAISYTRAKHEEPLDMSITQNVKYHQSGEEGAPLKAGSNIEYS